MILKLFYFYDFFKSKPFKWGEWDCAIVAKTWVKYSTGINFDIPVCSSMSEYRQINMIAVIDSLLTRTDETKVGDIVVFNNNRGLTTAGIYFDKSIITIGKQGLTAVQFKPLISWGLPCRK